MSLVRKVFSKVGSRIPAVVGKGAKDAQQGKRGIPVESFAEKGRREKNNRRGEKL